MSDLEFSDPYDPDEFEHRPVPRAAPPAPPARDAADAPPPQPPPAGEAGGHAVPWKAAASSVPRLRQQPVTLEPAATEGSFQGFAQDSIPGHESTPIGELPGRSAGAGFDDGPLGPPRPMAVKPRFWDAWLDPVRALPLPVALGGCAVLLLVVVLAFVLSPREQASVSLSRILQHPEAFDGRQVAVSGRAGETFSIGGSYVFNLRQGRDTIVVYSRTRRPAPNESVRATGTVSIGYLDGAPRVALLEEPPTP